MSSTPAIRSPECTVVVPVYRNAENVKALLLRLSELDQKVPGGIEVVCVVDGSPDASWSLLAEGLPNQPCPSQLLLLSRNYGSFAAIREGMRVVHTPYCAVMAADLQEPIALIESFFRTLRTGSTDVVVGQRMARADSLAARFSSGAFWWLYRKFVQPELPPGGIDVFACNAQFRERLLSFTESNTSLVGQIIWLGFRREVMPYERVARETGRSAWTLRKKLRYLNDSLYSFSDMPIRIFTAFGAIGLALSAFLTVFVLTARLSDGIEIPGYAATAIMILFFGGANLLGLGIIGSYVWRAYENTKARPLAIVMEHEQFETGAKT